ncbi:MAG: hypothetical protein NTU61_01490, partial [Candidatus Altiarchaeota archaeon]|nr:hypothetical protein [Candidatus Altiarchaeota archaeon]
AFTRWESDRRYYTSLTTERYPGEFEGMLPDAQFKPLQIESTPLMEPPQKQPTESARQARIRDMVSQSQFASVWAQQAKRMQLPEGDGLERILEFHAIRSMIMEKRENLNQFKTERDELFRSGRDPQHSEFLRKLRLEIHAKPPEELFKNAERDMTQWGEMSDDLLNPQKETTGVRPSHVFYVGEKPKDSLEGMDVDDISNHKGMGYIFAVLVNTPPKAIPERPELQGREFRYDELGGVVEAMKGKYREETGSDLDERVALITLGRYLRQKNIRMLGFSPTLVRLVGNDEGVFNQVKTSDDLTQLVGENANKILSTLEDHPFPVAMRGVLSRCFPNDPGALQAMHDRIKTVHPSPDEQKKFTDTLAYLSLGHAIEEGRVKVQSQGDTIIVSKS